MIDSGRAFNEEVTAKRTDSIVVASLLGSPSCPYHVGMGEGGFDS